MRLFFVSLIAMATVSTAFCDAGIIGKDVVGIEVSFVDSNKGLFDHAGGYITGNHGFVDHVDFIYGLRAESGAGNGFSSSVGFNFYYPLTFRALSFTPFISHNFVHFDVSHHDDTEEGEEKRFNSGLIDNFIASTVGVEKSWDDGFIQVRFFDYDWNNSTSSKYVDFLLGIWLRDEFQSSRNDRHGFGSGKDYRHALTIRVVNQFDETSDFNYDGTSESHPRIIPHNSFSLGYLYVW